MLPKLQAPLSAAPTRYRATQAVTVGDGLAAGAAGRKSRVTANRLMGSTQNFCQVDSLGVCKAAIIEWQGHGCWMVGASLDYTALLGTSRVLHQTFLVLDEWPARIHDLHLPGFWNKRFPSPRTDIRPAGSKAQTAWPSYTAGSSVAPIANFVETGSTMRRCCYGHNCEGEATCLASQTRATRHHYTWKG